MAEATQAETHKVKTEASLSLANRYAKPGVSYSDEEIRATFREIQSQWEEDFDERLNTEP